jgi:hypothetical protein
MFFIWDYIGRHTQGLVIGHIIVAVLPAIGSFVEIGNYSTPGKILRKLVTNSKNSQGSSRNRRSLDRVLQ